MHCRKQTLSQSNFAIGRPLCCAVRNEPQIDFEAAALSARRLILFVPTLAAACTLGGRRDARRALVARGVESGKGTLLFTPASGHGR